MIELIFHENTYVKDNKVFWQLKRDFSTTRYIWKHEYTYSAWIKIIENQVPRAVVVRRGKTKVMGTSPEKEIYVEIVHYDTSVRGTWFTHAW